MILGGFPWNNRPIPVVRTWPLKLSYSCTSRKIGALHLSNYEKLQTLFAIAEVDGRAAAPAPLRPSPPGLHHFARNVWGGFTSSVVEERMLLGARQEGGAGRRPCGDSTQDSGSGRGSRPCQAPGSLPLHNPPSTNSAPGLLQAYAWQMERLPQEPSQVSPARSRGSPPPRVSRAGGAAKAGPDAAWRD